MQTKEVLDKTAGQVAYEQFHLDMESNPVSWPDLLPIQKARWEKFASRGKFEGTYKTVLLTENEIAAELIKKKISARQYE